MRHALWGLGLLSALGLPSCTTPMGNAAICARPAALMHQTLVTTVTLPDGRTLVSEQPLLPCLED